MESVDLQRRRGTLAWPLSWATADLLALAEAYPRLALSLLRAERPRLHLLAFVLAITSGKPSHEMLEGALCRPIRDVLANLGFGQLRGLRRLLGRIPGALLQPADYRLLAALLGDPSAAQVLYHATEVTAELLANLHALPEEMRSPVVVDAIAHVAGAVVHILTWTEIIPLRLPTLTTTDIRRRIGRCDSLPALRTELAKLLDSLPALETAPPRCVDRAVRVDTPSAIRDMGKHFRNCLSSFVDVEVDGTRHLYHWRSSEAEAVCEVARVGNLGWFLANVLGLENDALPANVDEQIRTAFARVSIHPLAVIEAYDDLYFATGRRAQSSVTAHAPTDRRRRGRYHAD